MSANEHFNWTDCYIELSNKILEYKSNRKELLDLLVKVFDEAGLNFPYMENKKVIVDICPFTVMGSFNRGLKDENRIAILKALKKYLHIASDLPTSFDGIPVLNNMKAWFFSYRKDQGIHDIDNLWDMFEVALSYADEPTNEKRERFVFLYDTVLKQNNVKWNLTMGLYWIRPFSYINLDDRNRKFIMQTGNLPGYFPTVFNDISKKMPDGNKYLFMCEQCGNAIKNGDFGYENLAAPSIPNILCKIFVPYSLASYLGSTHKDFITPISWLKIIWREALPFFTVNFGKILSTEFMEYLHFFSFPLSSMGHISILPSFFITLGPSG